MKPRNKFEQAVIAQSKHLHPITKAQTQWAFRECIDHYAYRLPKGKTTCMDCGHSWQMNETTEHCSCPQCGAGLQVTTTRARKLQQRQYFTVLTTSGGYQVLCMYLLIVGMEKSYQAVSSVIEIGQYWWNESGRQTVVAVQRIMGHYVDSFAYYSPMAIRNENEAYRFIAHCPQYPKTRVIDLNKYWQAYKITLRRGLRHHRHCPLVRLYGYAWEVGQGHAQRPLRLPRGLASSPRHNTAKVADTAR